MGNLYDTEPNELIEKASASLKAIPEIKAPEWAAYVKTGSFKERPPVREDWWHVRAAAILRTIYLKGPIGVSKLRTKYGGKKNRGMKPEHFYKGSGSIIRKILQQLEKAGLVVQASKGGHKGRVITPKGAKILSQSSAPRASPKAEKAEKAPKAKAEETIGAGEEAKQNIKETAKEDLKEEQPQKAEAQRKPVKEKSAEKVEKKAPEKKEKSPKEQS